MRVPGGWPERGKVLGSVRGLKSQAAVRASPIVGQVFGEDALGMALVSEENVVGATSSYGADHALRKCVRLRRTRRRDQGPRAKSANSGVEHTAVDGVAVMDEEMGSMVGVDGRLDNTLGGPGRGGMRGDAEVDQTTSAEREHDEDVENAEPRPGGDDVPELGKFASDHVFAPCRVLTPLTRPGPSREG
jgi:hypothetical protein